MKQVADLPLLSWTPSQARAATDEVGRIPEHVREMFEGIALRVFLMGKKTSAKAILEHMRWNEDIEREGPSRFKLNNNWTAPLARWFMSRNPNAMIFETRQRRDR